MRLGRKMQKVFKTIFKKRRFAFKIRQKKEHITNDDDLADSVPTPIPPPEITAINSNLEPQLPRRPILIPDVLENVFELLTERTTHNDVYTFMAYPTLFNCLLVNKVWCDCAVRILYRQFRHYRQGFYRNYELLFDRSKLIRLYLSLIDEDSRKSLSSEGIVLPPQNLKPMYNYPSYIRELDYGRLVQAVGNYYNVNHEDRNKFTEKKAILILRALLQLFARPTTGAKLVCLNFSHVGHSFRTRYYWELLADSEIGNWLSDVRLLQIDSERSMDGHLFPRLPRSMSNVDQIEVRESLHTSRADPHFSNLVLTDFSNVINTQSNLRSLTLQSLTGMGRLLSAIEIMQTNSLVELRFIKCDFEGCSALTAIASCTRLITLEFIHCQNVTKEMVQPLFDVEFPMLRKVSVHRSNEELICPELENWALMQGSW